MFTFTHEELRQLLSDAITDFAGKGIMDYIEQYRQDRAATVERIMAQLEASQPQRDTRLENSLPYWEKEGEFEAHLKWLAENNPEWLKKAFDASNIPNSLLAIDEDEIFTDALKSDPPIFCPDCGDELSSIETGDKIWCMRCGYTSNNSLDNISPVELGLLPAA